jgi:hypothetical protein
MHAAGKQKPQRKSQYGNLNLFLRESLQKSSADTDELKNKKGDLYEQLQKYCGKNQSLGS